MAAYSLTQYASVLLLYEIGSNLSDIEYLYIDLFLITVFAFFFGLTKAYEGEYFDSHYSRKMAFHYPNSFYNIKQVFTFYF